MKKLLYKVMFCCDFATLHELDNDRYEVEIKLENFYSHKVYDSYNHACYKFDWARREFEAEYGNKVKCFNC